MTTVEFSCLCSFSDPVTYLTDPTPFPHNSFSWTFCLSYSHHSLLPFKVYFSTSPLKKLLLFFHLLAVLPFSFNSLFTLQFVSYSKSSTGVHLFQHLYSVSILLLATEIKVFRSWSTYTALLLSASGYSMIQPVSQPCFTSPWLTVQDQKKTTEH